MYRLLVDENFTPILSTFYKQLKLYRNFFFSGEIFDNLSQTEVEILSSVARDGYPNTAKEIATLLNVSKPLLSQNVEKLVNGRYLNKEIAQNDKRVQILTLGEKGLPLTDNLLSLGEDFNKVIMEDVSEEEFRVLNKVLKKMTKNLEKAIQIQETKEIKRLKE